MAVSHGSHQVAEKGPRPNLQSGFRRCLLTSVREQCIRLQDQNACIHSALRLIYRLARAIREVPTISRKDMALITGVLPSLT